jgi:DNA polymerase elongation subunit (family B)
MPFPQDTFDIAFEAELKHLFFFKGGGKEEDDEMDEDDFINKHKGFMKKNYVYVTVKDKVEIKNLGVRKKSNSPLSRKIFWEYLVPQIKEGKIKFGKTYLKQLINDLLKQDIMLASMRKVVGPMSEYSKSPNGLQAQISQKYGSGIHFMIPNTKDIGVGKGKSYCTIEEFKKHNLRIEDIDLENVYSELEYFTKQAVTMNICFWGYYFKRE